MNIIAISISKFMEIGIAIPDAAGLPISKYLRGRYAIDTWLIEHKLMIDIIVDCVMNEGLTYKVPIKNDALTLQFKLTFGL
jgi:hypothetical protein